MASLITYILLARYNYVNYHYCRFGLAKAFNLSGVLQNVTGCIPLVAAPEIKLLAVIIILNSHKCNMCL